jgi:16S rRNA (guanine(966)-N(2))-methyltransferase RsmD
MRIIAGSLKGRRLKAPAWEGLRPTSDKVRETLFNILAPRVSGARVIDGFAGTGALGIEAMSRGAVSVAFVERDRRAQALLEENLAHCGLTNGCVIIRASVARAIDDFRQAHSSFDLILLDPPYDEAADEVVGAASEVLAQDGTLVLEHARRRPAVASAGRLARTRQVISGDSVLSFYSCLP